MASITTQSNGRRLIQFVGTDGKRRSIRLGKMPMRTAEAVKVKVEQLVAAVIARHPPDNETNRWVADLDDLLREKLASVGLVSRGKTTTLGAYLDSYVKQRSDVKGSTATVYGHTRRNLLAFFGAVKPPRDITLGDADQWRLYLLEEGLADNTVRRRCGIAKQFFRFAQRKGLIAMNPFVDLVSAVRANERRFYFVSAEEAQKVLDACPNHEWRLLFALSRYGGLRCPSEHLSLKWGHVDWERGRVTVPSPKTEHHEGKATRTIPLFPELRPHLEEAFERAEPGADWVITMRRDVTKNLRTRFTKIIRRAGLEPWPKLFQNLRSTRETELADQFPLHVVVAWLGNSQLVAAKHYLQVTDEHYERAAKPSAETMEPAQKALQNAMQQPAAEARIEPHSETTPTQDLATCGALPQDANPCNQGVLCKVGDTGPEHLAPIPTKTQNSSSATAKIPRHPPNDQLARLSDVWETLPQETRDRILKLAGLL